MVSENIIILSKHIFSKNKIFIFMFQRMLFLEINLVNLKETHAKY